MHQTLNDSYKIREKTYRNQLVQGNFIFDLVWSNQLIQISHHYNIAPLTSTVNFPKQHKTLVFDASPHDPTYGILSLSHLSLFIYFYSWVLFLTIALNFMVFS